MIEQNVQVVAAGSGKIRIRMGVQAGCSACENGQGCGAGVFTKLLQRKPLVLELPAAGFEVQVGQMLTLAFPEQVYLRLVMAHYGWPLLLALVGAVAGYYLAVDLDLKSWQLDLMTLTGAIVAAALSLRLLKRRKRLKRLIDYIQLADVQPSVSPDMCRSGSSDSP